MGEKLIRSFRHKGLEAFHEAGSLAGIQPAHKAKLELILTVLDSTASPEELQLAGSFSVHKLTGVDRNRWSIKVSRNWRVTFEYSGGDTVLVDYLDYH